jgi:hypothetical protein
MSMKQSRLFETGACWVLAVFVVLCGAAWSPAALSSTTPAVVPPPELKSLWSAEAAPRLQGQARMRFLGFTVYDIRLWTHSPQMAAQTWTQHPFALELEYATSLQGRAIAQRSLQEMERGGPMAKEVSERWLSLLTSWFPDVAPGDRLTGVYGSDGSLRFFHNARERAHLRDPELAQRFFGIWLSPWTSQPQLREQLFSVSR